MVSKRINANTANYALPLRKNQNKGTTGKRMAGNYTCVAQSNSTDYIPKQPER